MGKPERLLEMLEYIREWPHITAPDLALICGISERGVYRYVKSLRSAGLDIDSEHDGYMLTGDWSKIIADTDTEDIAVLKDAIRRRIDSSGGERRLRLERWINRIESLYPTPSKWSIRRLPPGCLAPQRGTVRIGHTCKPEPINPLATYDSISAPIMDLIYSSLVKFDESGLALPDLATSWQVSDDGCIWTFALRKGVYFHDGVELTARDLKYTYDALATARPELAERVKLISETVCYDNKFQIRLTTPFGPALSRLNWPIAPAHTTDVVGTGPFRFVAFTDNRVILDANPRYYEAGRPVLRRVVFQYTDDVVQTLQDKQVDIGLDLTPSNVLFVTSSNGFSTCLVDDGSMYALLFDMTKTRWKNRLARYAVRYAIDKREIVRHMRTGRVCEGTFGPDSWGNDQEPDTPPNREASIATLKKCGFHKGGDLRLRLQDSSIEGRRIAVAVKTQLLRVGLNVVIADQEPDMILSRLCVAADPDSCYRFWHSSCHQLGPPGYSNAEVDSLFEQGRRCGKSRVPIYRQIDKLIRRDCPAIFIASATNCIVSKYIDGTAYPSLSHWFTSIKDWQIVDNHTAGLKLNANSLSS